MQKRAWGSCKEVASGREPAPSPFEEVRTLKELPGRIRVVKIGGRTILVDFGQGAPGMPVPPRAGLFGERPSVREGREWQATQDDSCGASCELA
jgi:hypothetical protein